MVLCRPSLITQKSTRADFPSSVLQEIKPLTTRALVVEHKKHDKTTAHTQTKTQFYFH